MRYMYDKNQFGKRIHELRKLRWTQYKSSKQGEPEHKDKFACCKSQESLAEQLGVERRAVSGWETGSNSPSLDNLVNLCDLLDCNIDYLLGANDYAEISPIALASHFSGIAPDIIRYGKENSKYLDCLNYFMHPDNCSALFNDITLSAWKKYVITTRLTDIANPLKEIIVNAFNDYYAFTSFENTSKDTFANFLSAAILRNISDVDGSKLIDLSKSCLPPDLYKNLCKTEPKINYNDFVSCLADYTFEPLTQRSYLELQETKLSKSFIKLFESYLEEA